MVSQGEVVYMAWSIVANHGGGYQYRLCPKNAKLTEECFQKTVLRYSGDQQWVQTGPNVSTRSPGELVPGCHHSF